MELANSRTIAFEDIDPVMHMMVVYKILSLQQVHKSVLLCIIHIWLVTILSSEVAIYLQMMVHRSQS